MSRSASQANGDSDGDEDRPSALRPRPESHAIIDSSGPKASTTMCHRSQYPASGTVAHTLRTAPQCRDGLELETCRGSRDGIRCLCPGFGRRTEVCVCVRWGTATNPSMVPVPYRTPTLARSFFEASLDGCNVHIPRATAHHTGTLDTSQTSTRSRASRLRINCMAG